jgi:hypothetical protein
LGGNGAASETAVDNFTFINELEDYETIIYNQVITIPLQAPQQRELDKKRKSTKEQPIILRPMPLLQKKFKPFFIISLLMDNWWSMHIFPFYFQQILWKKWKEHSP